MRAVFAVLSALVMAVWATAGAANAEGKPLVVVELFTSQGCSSCPPADALLAELATDHPDVLPLALHVDYWDYIGWADGFARPEHTVRQKAYAHAAGMRSIYTPQMVIGGVDHVIGFKPMKVGDFLATHRGLMGSITLDGSLDNGVAQLRAEVAGGRPLPKVLSANLVRFTALETVQITRGENAGHSLEYANIVTDMQVVGEWNGQGVFELETPVEGEGGVAILIQAAGPGPILAAIRLR